jgi:glucose dehydrogenase
MRARPLLLPLLVLGCAQLAFLQPPSVPRPTGSSKTERGVTTPAASDLAQDPAADWSGYNNALTGSRFSPLREITPRNAGALRQVCAFDLHERAALESGPAVVGGVLFVTTPKHTYAIDAATHASTGQPIGGGVILYEANDRQLIAVAAGLHAPTTWRLEASEAQVIVYGLP